MARGAAGHVLSLLDAQASGIRIELRTPKRRSATLLISVRPGTDSMEIALPAGDWLTLVLDFLPGADNCTAWTLRVRSALCRATIPDGIETSWTVTCLRVCAPLHGAPRQLLMGTRALQQTGADVRMDLVSVLPRACVESLSPAGLLGCEDDAGRSSFSCWEAQALRERGKACLLRRRSRSGALKTARGPVLRHWASTIAHFPVNTVVSGPDSGAHRSRSWG